VTTLGAEKPGRIRPKHETAFFERSNRL